MREAHATERAISQTFLANEGETTISSVTPNTSAALPPLNAPRSVSCKALLHSRVELSDDVVNCSLGGSCPTPPEGESRQLISTVRTSLRHLRLSASTTSLQWDFDQVSVVDTVPIPRLRSRPLTLERLGIVLHQHVPPKQWQVRRQLFADAFPTPLLPLDEAPPNASHFRCSPTQKPCRLLALGVATIGCSIGCSPGHHQLLPWAQLLGFMIIGVEHSSLNSVGGFSTPSFNARLNAFSYLCGSMRSTVLPSHCEVHFLQCTTAAEALCLFSATVPNRAALVTVRARPTIVFSD